MEHDELKLPVNLYLIKEELRLELTNIEKTGDKTFSGNWIHDGKVYDNVVIPFEIEFSLDGASGGSNEIHVSYTVYYDVIDSKVLLNSFSNILDDEELAHLRDSISIINMSYHVENVWFYDLEII
jgi:hypothetical protein